MESSDRSSDWQDESPSQFASTHWSLVLAAGDQRNNQSTQALEDLCRAYWPPLYAYARRRVGDLHQAQDLTQAFFERLLEKHDLAAADPQRGRFRAFLITSFKHFLSNEQEKATAQKRGGDRAHFPLDFGTLDSRWASRSHHLTAERLYERQWAITLLDRVMRRLQLETERSAKPRQFELLKEFIGGSSESSYASVAGELDMSTAAARMAASRLRARYCQILRDELAQTVSSQSEIDGELQHLFEIFAN